MGYATYSFKVKRPNPGKVRHLLAFMAGPWRRGLNFCVEQAKQHRPRRAFDLHPFVYLRSEAPEPWQGAASARVYGRPVAARPQLLRGAGEAAPTPTCL